MVTGRTEADMKRYGGDYWKAVHLNGQSGLLGQYDSIREVRKLIDETNERQIEAGYKAEKFLIVSVEWNRFYDDDGVFRSSDTLEQVVEKYGAGVQENMIAD